MPEDRQGIFAVNITVANQNLEALASYGSGDPLLLSVLNAGGTPIAVSTANGVDSLRAYVASLPMGTYYAEITSSGTGENNYQLTINVTP